MPVAAPTMKDAIRMGAEIFHALEKQLKDAGHNTGIGDEGGFAPNLKSAEDACSFICKAIEAAGYKPGGEVMLALDAAASEFHKNGKYELAGEGKSLDTAGIITYYEGLVAKFPIISIEDAMGEHDTAGWAEITKVLGKKIQLVRDRRLDRPERRRKSTTLHAIMGIVRPPRGLRLRGRSLRGRPPEAVARSGIALVPEGRRIFADLTVEENLRSASPAGATAKAVRGHLAQSTSCSRSSRSSADATAGALSGGQQQQLAIARALVARSDCSCSTSRRSGCRRVSSTSSSRRWPSSGPRTHDPAGRAAGAANRRAGRSHVPDRERRAPSHPTPDDAGDTERMVAASCREHGARTESWQRSTPRPSSTRSALGAVYALMAVGIGLVFGVLRLVNFAYGQLIMAGAFALALASERGWPVWAASCSASPSCSCSRLPWIGVVFRPLRTASPAVDARRDVRRRLPAAEHRAALVRRARARRASSLGCSTSPSPSAASTSARSLSWRSLWRRPACGARAAARPHDHRPA